MDKELTVENDWESLVWRLDGVQFDANDVTEIICGNTVLQATPYERIQEYEDMGCTYTAKSTDILVEGTFEGISGVELSLYENPNVVSAVTDVTFVSS